MNIFETGDKVIVISFNYGVGKGTIITPYDDLEMAIVELDSGEVDKVPYRYIIADPEYDTCNEPVKEPSIEITPEQFEQIAESVRDDVIVELDNLKEMYTIMFNHLVTRLGDALFNETVSND